MVYFSREKVHSCQFPDIGNGGAQKVQSEELLSWKFQSFWFYRNVSYYVDLLGEG